MSYSGHCLSKVKKTSLYKYKDLSIKVTC